ncbi:phage terminase large subunit [Proteiniborus sp. MB09-C3]|uniref:PBSX family phage terminase large subunit n=1 Tax=Proteiniborus sp. MB09-C3 TaxID=3050072 RepID=UPI002555BCBA|nr:phage terminase large subunit [Proteiniborus sp. MB09-C3]WIV13196.1 phage terminase large subunit [Proteiniborus sp. MB09-C3]
MSKRNKSSGLQINMNNLIIDTFTNVVSLVMNRKVDRLALKGGRSSTKSQIAAYIILMFCMIFNVSAIAIIKIDSRVRERLVPTFISAMNYMGIRHRWKYRKSPDEFVLLDKFGRETDVSIRMMGCKDPELVRSARSRSGQPFGIVWFEEAANFASYKVVKDMEDTLYRGGAIIIYTYNPPRSTSAWVNELFNKPCGKVLGYDSNEHHSEFISEYEEPELDSDGNKTGNMRTVQVVERLVVHHSTYKDVIDSGHASWLQPSFIASILKSEKENYDFYRWNYLGEVIGTDANIFSNVYDINIDEVKEQLDIDRVYRGLDWGYGGPDPTSYTEWFIDRKNNDLYLLAGFHRPNMSPEEVAEKIKELNKFNFQVIADCGVPLLNTGLMNNGVNVRPVKKQRIDIGIRVLQSFNHIYIDKRKFPEQFNEFKNAEWKVDEKTDSITSTPVDKNNHSIDSCRYSLEEYIKNLT